MIKHEHEFTFLFTARWEAIMTAFAPLGAFQKVPLPQGTLCYRDEGRGPTLVFVHGLLANNLLWSHAIARLTSQFRCIAPDLPLGAHSHPMKPDADLSPRGVAQLAADF